jgi:hypothetical protein
MMIENSFLMLMLAGVSAMIILPNLFSSLGIDRKHKKPVKP